MDAFVEPGAVVQIEDASPQGGASASRSKLLVYIPSYGRAAECISQVQRLREQRDASRAPVFIVVAINGDASYSESALLAAGADLVIARRLNIGGNANICLGFEFLGEADYVWILSDDDWVVDGSLDAVLGRLDSGPDMVVGTHEAPMQSWLEPRYRGHIAKAGGFIDLVSASVYRSETFAKFASIAFERIITSYPHAALIEELEARLLLKRIELVDIRWMVDTTRSKEAVQSRRRQTSARFSAAFFGGSLMASIDDRGAINRRRLRAWWRTHWHRASMYRRSPTVQQAWADGLARSSIATGAWWALSLPPFWRAKDLLRPIRGASEVAQEE